jgi:hypothetical protein
MAHISLDQTSLPFTIAYTDAKGNAVVPAAGTVTVSDDNVAVATVSGVSADATSGVVAPVAVGTCNLTATGPSGAIPLTGGDVEVDAAPPVAGAVTFGPAV